MSNEILKQGCMGIYCHNWLLALLLYDIMSNNIFPSRLLDVMDVISIGFILFNEEYRTLYITLTLLYMSLMLFFVVFISFSIFFLSRGEKMPFYKQSLNYFVLYIDTRQ